MIKCDICGKIAKSKAGLGQHYAYMHGPNSEKLRIARSVRAKGIIPVSKGKTKEELPFLARPGQQGKTFGISKNGHTDITRQKISQKLKGNTNAHHRGDRQSRYNDIRMDSKWEIGVAAYFDKNNITWKYNEKGYKLADGSVYYPDFFIYENGILLKLVEVKGYFREKNKEKFNRFLLEFPDIIVELWTRDKLRELGIINNAGYLKD